MKVSITFDKDVKQSSKKQWVKQIQDVVEKLNNKSKAQSNKQESPMRVYPPTSYRKENRNQCEGDSQNFLVGELLEMQKIMQQKFSILTRSIGKLSQKLNNVQKRVSVLQSKEVQRMNDDQDFDQQFAQISLKYEKLKQNSGGCQKNRRIILKETAASGFDYVEDEQQNSKY